MKYSLGTPQLGTANNTSVKSRLRAREFVPLFRKRDGLVILAFTDVGSESVKGLTVSAGVSGNSTGTWFSGYNLEEFTEYTGMITLEN